VVEVRRGAACALRSAATKDVIAPLSGMLQDQDQMVRYYAATGLAAATRQPDRLVSVDGYRQNESEHLAYWHKWADAHRN
jgi:HEAT repeat protein